MDFLLSYSVSDFILFSREGYVSVLRSYNAWLWPGQIAFLLLSLAIGYFVLMKRAKTVCILAALAWIWTGSVFHLQHFATINWASAYFAWLFLAEALLLLVLPLALRFDFRAPNSLPFRLGVCIYAVSAFIPVLWFRGYPWQSLTAFGWGAEMTAWGTFGLLLAMKRRSSPLLAVPIIFIVISVIVEAKLL